MFRISASVVGVAAVAALLLSVRPASAWELGGPAYQRGLPNGTPPPSAFGYPLDDNTAGYYGGMRYNEYYKFGRGYGVANFPPPLPGAGPPPYPPPYPMRPPGVRPPWAPPPLDPEWFGLAPAKSPPVVYLEVHVPADAEVWMEGSLTKQTGPTRYFVSPPLTPGEEYSYELKARWKENGRDVEQKQEVTVKPGPRPTVVRFAGAGGEEPLPAPRPFPLQEGR